MSPVPVRARVPANLAPAPRTGREVPTATPRARPPLRLVDNSRLQVAARRKRARRLAVVAAVFAVAGVLALAGAHAMLVSSQVRLDALQQQVAEAQARHQSLRLEVARLEAPDRVVSTATERLGMVPPDTVTYLQPAEVPVPAAAPDPITVTPATGTLDDRPRPSWGSVKPYLGP